MADDQLTPEIRDVIGRARRRDAARRLSRGSTARSGMRRFVRRQLAAMVIAGLGVSGCAQVTAPTGAATTAPTVLAAAPTPSAAATRAPKATAAFPAPAQLIGRWRTELKPGDVVTLQLTESGYIITRFDTGRGHIEVEGNEIRFSGSNLCTGESRYHWSIDGDKLHFEPFGGDPCDGRAEVLKNVTYTRLG